MDQTVCIKEILNINTCIRLFLQQFLANNKENIKYLCTGPAFV